MALGNPTSRNGSSSNVQVGSSDARVPQLGSSSVQAMVEPERGFLWWLGRLKTLEGVSEEFVALERWGVKAECCDRVASKCQYDRLMYKSVSFANSLHAKKEWLQETAWRLNVNYSTP